MTLNDFLSGSGFDEIVDAIEELGRSYTNENRRHSFRTPAFVIKVSGSVVKCAQLNTETAVCTRDSTAVKDLDDFTEASS